MGKKHQILEILANLAKIEKGQRGKEVEGKRENGVESFKKSDWEPFNLEPNSEQRFINLYGGMYSAQMELNRKNAEELIKVAALKGQIILTTLPATRTHSIEVNPDGSVTAKCRLFWGEKIEDSENPNFRVTSIPEGWKIEICDQAIFGQLQEKFQGEKLKKKFAAYLNQYLRAGIWQAVWKEKLTDEKTLHFQRNIFFSLMYPAFWAGLSVIGGFTLYDIANVGGVLFNYGFSNYLNHLEDKQFERPRTLESFYEYFMPRVEVDRVARGFLYLNLKGRNLVHLKT